MSGRKKTKPKPKKLDMVNLYLGGKSKRKKTTTKKKTTKKKTTTKKKRK